jgi:hypothetical protein
MLETLEGRLKWERTGDGIRVVIPVRMGWLPAMSGISLWILPAFAVWGIEYFIHLSRPVSVVLNEISLCSGVCLVILWFAMIFTLEQVLTLNPAEVTFQARALGIGIRKRSVATSRLSNLRFVHSEYGDLVSMDSMSRIEIDRDFKTRKFAFGITEGEAETLIEKMLEVYRFPDGPAR